MDIRTFFKSICLRSSIWHVIHPQFTSSKRKSSFRERMFTLSIFVALVCDF
uniref:Uncharacterized protein n=1 Tax=Utricularia reniformis TaxID=192314 RepID=A0A1Y0B1T2_9LAMI|nr:hypothetical protein AEK19_MT1103 [Utricularia reniformis]ART31323.1 hypothetical protein AEK19_MT1103 [Utricularia reniformis]